MTPQRRSVGETRTRRLSIKSELDEDQLKISTRELLRRNAVERCRCLRRGTLGRLVRFPRAAALGAGESTYRANLTRVNISRFQAWQIEVAVQPDQDPNVARAQDCSERFIEWLRSPECDGYRRAELCRSCGPCFVLRCARRILKRARDSGFPGLSFHQVAELEDTEIANDLWLLMMADHPGARGLRRRLEEAIFIDGDAGGAAALLAKAYRNSRTENARRQGGWEFMRERLRKALDEAKGKPESGVTYRGGGTPVFFGFGSSDEQISDCQKETNSDFSSWPAPDANLLYLVIWRGEGTAIVAVAKLFWLECVGRLERETMVSVDDLTKFLEAHTVFPQGQTLDDIADPPSETPTPEESALLRAVCNLLTDDEVRIASARDQGAILEDIGAMIDQSLRTAKNRVDPIVERIALEVDAIKRQIPHMHKVEIARKIMEAIHERAANLQKQVRTPVSVPRK